MPTVYARALERAAQVLGSKERLRARLGVKAHELEQWLSGGREPPTEVFLATVDILSSTPVVARARPLRTDMVESALDRALSATGARMGNVQLARSDGLHIVAQRGFAPPFLEFFARVSHDGSACGAALKQCKRIVVADVATDPIFVGTVAGSVLKEAHVRAVQSTPLLASSGWVLGVLSTHYEERHTPSGDELDALDEIARRAAYWLESGAA
jgi:DNA-binding transcriptional regulator YdaS (Cro superfamily)